MFTKQRDIPLTQKSTERSPLLNEFLDFVQEHRGDPEFDEAMFKCHNKWRNETGIVGLRYQIIAYASTGEYNISEISRRLDVDVKTTRAWIVRFMEEGLEGLQDKPRSGRPPKPKESKVQKATKSTKARKGRKGSKAS